MDLVSSNCTRRLQLSTKRLLQFLMGLNDSYEQARGQVLMMVPLPTLNKTYSLLIERESQRTISQTASSSTCSELSVMFTTGNMSAPRTQGYGRGSRYTEQSDYERGGRQNDHTDYHKGMTVLHEQYNQILHMLGQSNVQGGTEATTSSSGQSSANLAHQENYSSAGPLKWAGEGDW